MPDYDIPETVVDHERFTKQGPALSREEGDGNKKLEKRPNGIMCAKD